MTKIAQIFLVSILIFSFKTGSGSEGDTTVIAGEKYKAGFFKKIFLGTHYRKEWTTPVTVAIFEIDTIMGGLTPIKQGGSRQTTNLRLKDSLGREYVIRSVDKTPSHALEKELRQTIAGDLIEDQTSAEHPFGPLTIAPMAKAAGLYYNTPRLFFIPYDTSFGEYTETFAGMLAYFEERPNEDMSHNPGSGYSKNVIGTEKLFENLYKDPDNKVDSRFYAKARLFDMLIGDWGRHEDQWRWASFKMENGTLYRPVPRDRDHAYFKFDGVLPRIASSKGAFPQFCNFDDKMKKMIGLNRSATSIDKAFLNELSKEEWKRAAEELQKSLPDSVIENAIRKMPEQMFKLHGEEIIKKLKSRRDLLSERAEEYYKYLSKHVDVIGSEKKEYISVRRLSNRMTEVLMLKSKDHNDTLFYRMFDERETEEVRIYGLGGDDEFHIYGHTHRGMKIRIIGGEGEDKFTDSSSVNGLTRKNIFYDTEEGNFFSGSEETKDMRSDKTKDSVNLYRHSGYRYNFTTFVPSFEFNPDDGLFLGAGLLRKTYGFRKYPQGSIHRLGLSYATQTSAVSLRYDGDFIKFKGDWNMNFDIRLYGPKYVLNYFGFGNETTHKDTSITYYRVKASQFIISPVLYKNLNRYWEFGFGPTYQYTNVEKTSGRFIATPEAALDSSNFKRHQFLGIKTYTSISTIDNKLNPQRGMRWKLGAAAYQGLEDPQQYINLSSDFAVYYTPKFPIKMTFASRVGGATNFGDFLFFQANTLGGTTNLRGYRRTRFYGRSSFFHNTELRLKLTKINFYLFPATIGLLGFYDYGRVWADRENSDRMHAGYGPGFYMQIYNKAVLTGTYGFSEDAGFLNVNVGFLF
ncbi:MAG: outer membrane protein assembly factor [Cytophagaceae bacterium]|nr:outer membrane protein assembly factor [Cytophagaceae bacterium]